MAQHDYVISNASGSAVRSDLNNALAAIVTTNSGSSEPTTTYAYQFWADTSAGVLKIRNGANNAWITLRELDGTFLSEDGSASSPGIAFASDTNTGLYRIGADELGIAANGAERARIGSTAVVFNDAGADVDFRIEGDTKANLFVLDAGTDSISIDGNLTLANQSDLRLGDSDNSNWVALQAPATVSSNVTWTLPAADGTADQVLKTDGSGVLSWAANTTYASTAEVGGTHTTGSVTSGSASLTVASATGITAGMFVVGEGITPGTTVSSIASTTVTLSANAAATLSSDPVAFYIANKALSPGLVAGQLCRAWVNFDGTGTVAIRAAYNVSSITDNGTGDYTVNFTTAMPDANYVVAAGAGIVTTASATGPAQLFSAVSGSQLVDSPPATGSFRFVMYNYSGTALADIARLSISIFR